jgi:hypothetical protein
MLAQIHLKKMLVFLACHFFFRNLRTNFQAQIKNRKIMKMKQLLIVALIASIFSSCLKSSPPPFRIGPNIIFFQEMEGDEEELRISYVPLVQVWGSDTMTSCSCMHSSMGIFNLSKITGMYWRSSYPAGERATTIPSGNFTITATSASQESVLETIPVAAMEGMSQRFSGELDYYAETRELKAKFDKIAGATVYGITLIQGDYFLADTEIQSYTASQLESLGWSVTISFTEAMESHVGEYELVIYAAKLGEWPIVQLGARRSVEQ